MFAPFSVLGCMGRPIRFIPEGGALVEVTCRTLQSRFLLRPSPALNEIVIGVLARAQQLYPVRFCAFVFLSNHFHLLLRVESALQLSRFMNHVNSNLAREAGRLANWREKFWGRRYEAIVVSDEPAAQIERLRYVLAHGCKEGLVERPSDWPGVHVARALAEGFALEGYWFDRTREYAARLRGEDFDRLRYATRETISLDPLPCWGHLAPERLRERVTELVTQIETEARAERERTGRTPPGRRAILNQHQHDRPNRTKKSPAPLFHAATQRVRHELYTAYRLFVSAFREAAERLRAGDRGVIFPPGSFPPALPFVGG